MKKQFFLTALAFLSLTSFTKKNPSLLAKESRAVPFNAQFTFTYNDHAISDPCTNELIDVTGTEFGDIHGVYNPNTGTSTFDGHANFQGVTAVGETTGNKYQVTSTINDQNMASSDGCTSTGSAIENIRYTTAGANNNYYEKYSLKLIYNYCTGITTVTREKLSSGCQ